MDSKGYLLISAHHCAPNMGSEHAVGWNLVSRLALHYPVLLITQDNEFRSSIEGGIATLKAQGYFIDVFFVEHGSRTDGRKNNLRLWYYLTYILYQWRVYKLVQMLMLQYNIIATHHLTIVGFREPGFLWKLGLPFIWGPVGGLVFTPKELFNELTPKVKLFQIARNYITKIQFIFSWRVRQAYRATQRNGGAFIAATPDIGERFQRYFGGTFHWIPETGALQSGRGPVILPAKSSCVPLRILWVGGLLDIKPLGMLLDAIALVHDHKRRIMLTVVGDGDSRERYESYARRLKVLARFTGWCAHQEALEFFRQADLFVLLSAKDLTTNVVFEAMAHGLPVLCLDHHGYSHIVTEQCGVKIPISDSQQIRQHIARVLDELAEDQDKLAALSRGALKRANEFTWERNAEAIARLYSDVIMN